MTDPAGHQSPLTKDAEFKTIRVCRYVNAAILVALALFFFLIPATIVIRQLSDPHLRSAGIPKSAWELHRTLSPGYERWARKRLESARATERPTTHISGTEWPLFGSVFYLWATESLQDAWDKEHPADRAAPNVYARGAIEAATRLVLDPNQASWVKLHWGENYLKRENVFYRMLLIAAITSHARLTGDRHHLPVLQNQVESLSTELNKSRFGLLNDYPDECYPGDVLTAIAMIRRADKVLGTNHSAFVARAIRGFQTRTLDPRGLVPYAAQAAIGEPVAPTRGCGNAYVCLFAPELWPEQARKWYDLFTRYFWQETWTCAGFREFPNDLPGHEWYFDVDAGPVLKGFGCAACAFGLGAARVNGHFEHAYPLAAEMLVASWPLPNGTRLVPRLLSNTADAPYLGEAAILFNLTRLPAEGVPIRTGGSIPGFVRIFLTLQIAAGLVLLAAPVFSLRRWRRRRDALVLSRPKLQFALWLGLMLAAVVFLFHGPARVAIVLLLCAQFFPRCKRAKPPIETPPPAPA